VRRRTWRASLQSIKDMFYRQAMNRTRWLWFLTAIFSTALFAENFNPASVRSTTCAPPNYSCGFQAPAPELARSIPLVPSVQHRGLPSSVDLAPRMPPVSNQGQQNSCVAWATAYAMRSYHEENQRKWGYDAPVRGGKGDHVFSPAYVYNQINGGRDEGSVMENALSLMVREGVAPWSAMPYSDRDYRSQPNAEQKRAASSFKLQRYARLQHRDLDAIKAELAAGRPVIFGMGVDDAFYSLGATVYDGNGGKSYGGHAMTLVGYDDAKKSPRGHKGAFKIMNSWGSGWAEQGFGWISYQQWTKESPWALATFPNPPGDQIEEPSDTQTDEPAVEPEKIPPPAEVSASRGSFPDRIVVSWSQVQGAAAYVVIRAEPGSDEFQMLGHSQTTSFEDRAVQINTAYRYKIVAAVTQENYSDPEASPVAEGFASSGSGKPEKVTGLDAQAVNIGGRSAVNLKWAQTPLASSYEIARYESAAWKVIGTSQTLSFTDSAPPANATVAYAVRGAGAQRGPWSRAVQVKIAGENTPPPVPQNLRVSQGMRDKITVEWEPVPGASRYYVFRYSYEDESWSPARETTQPVFEDADPDVKSGDYFAYTVAASNKAGHSSYAKPAAGRANPNATRGVNLEPPLTVTGGVQGTTISISWEAVKGANQYSVFRAKKGDKPAFVASVTGNSYAAPFNETPGELYFYTIRAKSEFGGESADSRPVAAFTNKPRVVVADRRISDEGLDRFAGNWSGKFLERGSKPHIVNMKLSGREQKVQGSIRLGSDIFGFRGPYARGSNSIVADEVEIRLLDFGLVEVHFNSAQLGEVTAVLEREK
jgi:fibronectin type 3 domain-containing protein